MPFAAALRKSLEFRGSELPGEFARGDSLEDVLNRHLRTVEQMGGEDVFTCILLLSPDGKRLRFGAAPSLPPSYCRAAESVDIGPRAGSCGAAAYLGRAVYSVDIESDPVWEDYRDLPLGHGFRSCWSTPIRNSNGKMIGTFAILHTNVGMPTREEIEAIDMITGHVADAIMWFRDPRDSVSPASRPFAKVPTLKLVSNNIEDSDPAAALASLAEKLEAKAADLDRYADRSESEAYAEDLREAANLSRRLIAKLLLQVELIKSEQSRQ